MKETEETEASDSKTETEPADDAQKPAADPEEVKVTEAAADAPSDDKKAEGINIWSC